MWHRRFVNKHGYVEIEKKKRTAKQQQAQGLLQINYN